jgi:hypothetical protein
LVEPEILTPSIISVLVKDRTGFGIKVDTGKGTENNAPVEIDS